MAHAEDPEKTTYTRIAILMIVVGVLFALDSMLNTRIVRRLWPLLIALLGTGLIGIYAKRRSSGALYLAVGEYLIGFSGLALYLNFTSWHNIVHVWPLFLTFLGIAFVSFFFVDRRKRTYLLIGLILVSISITFFFIFGMDVRYWWTIFILIGMSILVAVKAKW